MENFRQWLQPPHIDPPDQKTIDILTDITDEEWKRNPIVQNEIKRAKRHQKKRHRVLRFLRIKNWITDNIVGIISAILTLLGIVVTILLNG